MKRCPSCDRTFDDSMRFCQSDGTPLAEDAPIDPYKTMVARPSDIASAMPPSEPAVPPPADDDQVLEIPADNDPNKTMFASEDEIRREMDSRDRKQEQVIEIPPLVEAPAPPKFNEPTINPPSFGGSTPPSPFSGGGEPASPFGKTTPPIPSPFSGSTPLNEPPPVESTPMFAEPEPVRDFQAANPFNAPSGGQIAQAEWTPPPNPDASWQNQQLEQNTSFQPPASGSGGLNQTLPIVSLVLGILSLCCYVSPLTGVGALITGYLGLKNIKNDPSAFGGRGLAIAGMVMGGLFLVISVIYWIFLLFFGGLSLLMNSVN